METAENLINRAFETLARAAADEKPRVFKCDDISPSAVIVAMPAGAGGVYVAGGASAEKNAGAGGGAEKNGAKGGAAFFVRVDGGALRCTNALSKLQRRVARLDGASEQKGANSGAGANASANVSSGFGAGANSNLSAAGRGKAGDLIIITGALGAGKTTFGEALAAQGLVFLPAKESEGRGGDFGADDVADCAGVGENCAENCAAQNKNESANNTAPNSNLGVNGGEICAEFCAKNGENRGENSNKKGEENAAQNSQNSAQNQQNPTQNSAQNPARTTPPAPQNELTALQTFYFKNAISFACECALAGGADGAGAGEIVALARRAREHGFKSTLVFLGFGELELFVARAVAARAGFAARLARAAKAAQTDAPNSNLGDFGGRFFNDFGAEFDPNLDENFKLNAGLGAESLAADERENGATLAQTGEILAQVVGELGAALAHFGAFCAACDEVAVYDNSRQKPRVLLRVVGGAVDFLVPADLRPRWLTDLARDVLGGAKVAQNPAPKMAKNGENPAQNPAKNGELFDWTATKIAANSAPNFAPNPAQNPAPNSNLAQELAQNQNENPALNLSENPAPNSNLNENAGEISNENPAQNGENPAQAAPQTPAKTAPKRAQNLRDLLGKI